ncbi:hypothetical protein ACG0Z6_03595 [Roseateles sp. BYS180W]|uniref:Uncharacterized protein n=1 Tax=Roseateles rivi TaxID=3299028 RepID=A0ABW7FSP7_9BURK
MPLVSHASPTPFLVAPGGASRLAFRSHYDPLLPASARRRGQQLLQAARRAELWVAAIGALSLIGLMVGWLG